MISRSFHDPFGGKGQVLSASPDKVVWFLELDDGNMVTCTQTRVDPVLEDNQRELNENAGKRWGDGRIAARIPLDLYFDKIAPAKRAGDDRYIKKIYNDSDYRKLRIFGGNL